MRQALALLLCLAAAPAWPQDAADAAGAAVAAPGAGAAVAEGAASPDPLAAWSADPSAVLPAAGVDLGSFEYVARPLVVFADSPLQPQLAEQLRLIEAELGELAARDVVVIVDSDPGAGSDVRRALRPRGFGLVLVDKDGRVLLRRPSPLSVRELARAIDRTPLRQEEIRSRDAGEG